MDAVELPLPAEIVTKIMRSSGCSGGGGAVTRVELFGSKSECSNSFHQDKDDNCNVNSSRPAFWNKISDEELYRQAGQEFVDHDMAEAKQSQRKSGKASRSNGNSSRRSRVAHMEASMNLTRVVDVNDSPKDPGSYSGKYSIAEKKQKTSVSGKRSDKRNAKFSKSKCDSFSVKAGLSSFSSAAGGNNILGVYGSKHDLYDFEKHVDEVSLNELLDGSYKCPKSIKGKEKKTEVLNGSILVSVKDACSILHSKKTNYIPNVQNSAISGATTNDDNKGDAADSSSSNKVENGSTDDDTKILQFPLFAPKDVLDRLALPPPKDLDLMLLDSMKPSSSSKVQNGGSLPTFPWSHISGRDFKANPDMVKSTQSKTSCQGRWVRMGKSTTSSLEDRSTTYLADFQSLTYNQNLVPLSCQQSIPTQKEKSPHTTFDQPSGTRTTASKNPAVHSAGVLSAAQTLCDIAAQYRKHDQDGIPRWQKKSSQKSIRASKLTSDEKLEKALFAIPSSRPMGPPNKLRQPVKEKVNNSIKGPYHWSTSTPQSSRSSPSKTFKNPSHESSSSPLKRSITSPPSRLPNKPPKLRKLVPMEWKSQKGNAKY